MQRAHEYAVRLFLAWLNERYGRAFGLSSVDGSLFEATEPEAGRLALYVIELFEASEAWQQRAEALANRLNDSRPGSYLLWVPPGGDLPDGEPDESEWVRRIVLAASKLASGRVGEARLPVRMALGKIRDEGGYASVTGGLGRHWTTIAEKLSGSYFLDSRGLNRFTRNEEERETLYDHIGMLGQGLAVGDITEFEHEDAWSIQRLPRGAAGTDMTDGWAITGCPTGFDANDGSAVRRVLRRRLAEATESLKGVRDAAKGIVLIGAYDYMSGENAGPSLRGFDPSLTAPFDIIGLIADAEVKPLRMSRGLSFTDVAAAP
ncbi:MAG TPA: hypothetical protein VJB57_12050 [Dehalococcoidia bacterium]|nr:hypothetical protein [Dehalococcoidia bacterium]